MEFSQNDKTFDHSSVCTKSVLPPGLGEDYCISEKGTFQSALNIL